MWYDIHSIFVSAFCSGAYKILFTISLYIHTKDCQCLTINTAQCMWCNMHKNYEQKIRIYVISVRRGIWFGSNIMFLIDRQLLCIEFCIKQGTGHVYLHNGTQRKFGNLASDSAIWREISGQILRFPANARSLPRLLWSSAHHRDAEFDLNFRFVDNWHRGLVRHPETQTNRRLVTLTCASHW